MDTEAGMGNGSMLNVESEGIGAGSMLNAESERAFAIGNVGATRRRARMAILVIGWREGGGGERRVSTVAEQPSPLHANEYASAILDIATLLLHDLPLRQNWGSSSTEIQSHETLLFCKEIGASPRQ